jgi:uncharacterized protein YhaN
MSIRVHHYVEGRCKYCQAYEKDRRWPAEWCPGLPRKQANFITDGYDDLAALERNLTSAGRSELLMRLAEAIHVARRVLADYREVIDNLTAVQSKSTELLERNRELRRIVEQLIRALMAHGGLTNGGEVAANGVGCDLRLGGDSNVDETGGDPARPADVQSDVSQS